MDFSLLKKKNFNINSSIDIYRQNGIGYNDNDSR